MRKLILIRHAKSSWNLPCKDINRLLLEVGIERAIKVAKKTKSLVNADYYFTSSPATRAFETAKIFLTQWNIPISNCLQISALYTFDVDLLKQIVKSYPNSQENVIIFGHNDAITEFVNKFGDVKIMNVPTAGFVEIIFHSNDWKSIKKGTTNTVIFPKFI